MAGSKLRALLALTLALAGSGCTACPPEAERLVLAPDFSSPETAGRSFWAAIACGEDVAAYKCLSEGLKREHGATLDAFLLYKGELEERYGRAFRYAFRLQPLGQPQGEGSRVRQWWGIDRQPLLALELEAQHFLDFYTRSSAAADGDFLERPPGALLHWNGGQLCLDVPAGTRARFPELSALRQLTIGTEWKVRDVLAPPNP